MKGLIYVNASYNVNASYIVNASYNVTASQNVNYTIAYVFVPVQFALKTQVIRSGLSAGIPKGQSILVTINLMNFVVTHLSVVYI